MKTDFEEMAQTAPFSPEFKMRDFVAAIQAIDHASQNFAKEHDEDQHSAACLDAQERVLTIALYLGRGMSHSRKN